MSPSSSRKSVPPGLQSRGDAVLDAEEFLRSQITGMREEGPERCLGSPIRGPGLIFLLSLQARFALCSCDDDVLCFFLPPDDSLSFRQVLR